MLVVDSVDRLFELLFESCLEGGSGEGLLEDSDDVEDGERLGALGFVSLRRASLMIDDDDARAS